jgi:hypothetical protein
MRIRKRVAGVFTDLAVINNLGFPATNTEFKIEFSVDGTTLRARLLTAADAVVNLGSGDYDISVVDSVFTAAGEVGVGRDDAFALQIAPTARTCMKDLTLVEL